MQVLTTAPAQVTAEHRQRERRGERLKEEAEQAEHASTVSETPRKMTLVEQRVEEMRRQFGPRADGRLDADVREFMVSTAHDPLMTRS